MKASRSVPQAFNAHLTLKFCHYGLQCGPPELKEIVHQKPTNTNDTKAVQCERNVRCEWWWRNSPRLRLQAAALKREF